MAENAEDIVVATLGLRVAQELDVLDQDLVGVGLDCQALFTEDFGQTLLVLTAAPGSESDDKLRLLSVVGRQFAF